MSKCSPFHLQSSNLPCHGNLLRIPAAACALLLVGCAAAPSVQYRKIIAPDDMHAQLFDTFALQQSHIKITGSKDAKSDKLDPASIMITSIPVEYGEFKLGVEHADSWGVRTNLNFKKIDNTDMVQEAGTEVVDNRVDLIAKVGGMLVKAVGFDWATLKPSNLPILVRTQPLLIGEQVGRDAKAGISVPGATIDFGALPKDARPISQLPLAQKVSAFVYAACRSATVTLVLGDDGRYTKTVKIADPRYFQLVNFPVKGKITTHTECGVSVSTDKDPGAKSGVDVAEALLTQAAAIKEAIAASKKSEN